MRFVDSQKEVPPDMEQAIRTIIWAADRAEVEPNVASHLEGATIRY